MRIFYSYLTKFTPYETLFWEVHTKTLFFCGFHTQKLLFSTKSYTKCPLFSSSGRHILVTFILECLPPGARGQERNISIYFSIIFSLFPSIVPQMHPSRNALATQLEASCFHFSLVVFEHGCLSPCYSAHY